MGKKQLSKTQKNNSKISKTTNIQKKTQQRLMKQFESIQKSGSQQISDQSESQSISDQSDQVKQTIHTIFIEFFQSIEQRDLVFKPQIRKILIKKFPHKNINPDHSLDPKEEIEKINSQLKNLQIIKFLQLKRIKVEQTYQSLKNFYEEAARIFPSEITTQLYKILSQVSNIVFLQRNDKRRRVKELRKFGNTIPLSQNSNTYFYFGFNMFNLPSDKEQKDIKKLMKHHPEMRYVLKKKYREKNGFYADFIKKVGKLVWKLLMNLKCKQILLE